MQTFTSLSPFVRNEFTFIANGHDYHHHNMEVVKNYFDGRYDEVLLKKTELPNNFGLSHSHVFNFSTTTVQNR